jgi:putative phage-type endonuclease
MIEDENFLYNHCKEFTRLDQLDRECWLIERKCGIGGSDASALIGENPWKTLRELWQEKFSKEKPKEILTPAIMYGTNAEEPLRKLYALKHPNQDVQYIPNVILERKKLKYEWMRYSPDGLIYDYETHKKGILEIKTASLNNYESIMKWQNNSVPIQYYIQTLHGLLVTGFDFVTLTAELRYYDGRVEIVERTFNRDEVLDDLEYLEQKELEVWNTYFATKKEPPILLKI